MEKLEYRSVIKFFVSYGLPQTEIHPELVKVYKESAPSISMVEKWTAEFKRGRTLIEYTRVKDGQELRLHQKTSIRYTIWF